MFRLFYNRNVQDFNYYVGELDKEKTIRNCHRRQYIRNNNFSTYNDMRILRTGKQLYNILYS